MFMIREKMSSGPRSKRLKQSCLSFVAKDKQDSFVPILGGRLCIVITNSLTFDLCMHDVFPNDMIRESKG